MGRTGRDALALPLLALVLLLGAPAAAVMLGSGVFGTPYWAACLACVVISLVARVFCGTWLHPAPLFSGTWAVYFAVPAFVVTTLNPAPTANSIIVLTIACAVLPISLIAVNQRNESHPRTVDTDQPMRWLVIAGGFTGVIAAMIATHNAGLGYTAAFGLTGLRRAGLTIAVSRYSQGAGLTAVQVLLLTVTYAGAVLAPFSAASLRHRFSRIATLVWPVFGASAFSVATTARQAMLVAAALTLASALMVRSLRGAGRARLPFRAVLSVILAGTAIAGAFVLAAFSRVNQITGDTQAAIFAKLGSYVGGSLPALNTWLTVAPTTDGLPWTQRFGRQTLAGIAGLVGRNTSSPYDFTQIDRSIAVTNVYTLFRAAITDFGIVGSILVVTGASFIAAIAWRRAMTTGQTWPLVLTAAFIAAGLYSGTASLFASTNICAGLIVAAVAMRFWARFPRVESGGASEPDKTNRGPWPFDSRPISTVGDPEDLKLADGRAVHD